MVNRHLLPPSVILLLPVHSRGNELLHLSCGINRANGEAGQEVLHKLFPSSAMMDEDGETRHPSSRDTVKVMRGVEWSWDA